MLKVSGFCLCFFVVVVSTSLLCVSSLLVCSMLIAICGLGVAAVCNSRSCFAALV